MSEQKLLQCPHTSQRARIEEGSPTPFTYYCVTCGETTSRSSEPSPLYGIPYHRSDEGSFWMGFCKTNNSSSVD